MICKLHQNYFLFRLGFLLQTQSHGRGIISILLVTNRDISPGIQWGNKKGLEMGGKGSGQDYEKG